MKIERYVSCYLPNVDTRFQIDIWKHLRNNSGKRRQTENIITEYTTILKLAFKNL